VCCCREGLHRLTQIIFSKAQPKRLGTQILSGPMLAGLTEAYVTAINNGRVGGREGGLVGGGWIDGVGGACFLVRPLACCLLSLAVSAPSMQQSHHTSSTLSPFSPRSAVPTIATAWQGVAEAESRRAGDAALAAYVATYRDDVPAEESALEAEHQHALMAAQKAFDEIAIGDEGVRRANEQRWRESCDARWVRACCLGLCSKDSTAGDMQQARHPGMSRRLFHAFLQVVAHARPLHVPSYPTLNLSPYCLLPSPPRRYQQLRERKLAQASAACEKLINEATMGLAALARQEGVTLERMQEAVAAFEQGYRDSAEASGPTKWPRFAGKPAGPGQRLLCAGYWLLSCFCCQSSARLPGLVLAVWRQPSCNWLLTLPPLPLPPLPAEFLRDAYGGAVRDLTARLDERRKAETAAAAQQAEIARMQAQQAEQRLASAEAGAQQLQVRLADAERRLAEAHAELARERAAAAAAATRLATLEQQVQHLTQSKEAEGRSMSQQAEAALCAAEQAHQVQLGQLGAARAEAERQAGEAARQLAAAQGELQALRQQAAASGAAAQDVSGRLAALAAEKDGLFNSVQVLSTEKAELQRAKEAAERQLAEVQQREQVGGGGSRVWGIGWDSSAGAGQAMACVPCWAMLHTLLRLALPTAINQALMHCTPLGPPPLQASQIEFAAQLRAKEEEARRAAQQAAAAAAAEGPSARTQPPSSGAVYMSPAGGDAGMEDGDEEFEDAADLPNISKMTMAQVRNAAGLQHLLLVSCAAAVLH
jgi:hypothetical protein